MHPITLTTAALGFTFAAATPVPEPVVLSQLAIFYEDNACSGNTTEIYNLSTSSCISPSLRGSIYFEGEPAPYSLAFSPTPNCTCQNYCTHNLVTATSDCLSLAGFPPAQSFSFQLQNCSANTC